jgi:acetate kinase
MIDWSGRKISRGEYVLNKESGFKGVFSSLPAPLPPLTRLFPLAMCGTNNFGEITARAYPSSSKPEDAPTSEEHLASRLTYQHYLDRLVSFLAPYLSSIFSSPSNSPSGNTLDALVFSGGIGEKSAILRRDVLRHFQWIEELAGTGGGVDDEKNEGEGEGEGRWRITKEGSKVPAWVVETSEEDEMVRIAEEEMQKQGK